MKKSLQIFSVLFLCSASIWGQNLGNSPFFEENVCGLNFIQASQLTETRTVSYGFNTNGTGFPATDTVKGLPSTCAVVQKAYLYFTASYTELTAPDSTVIITNPANITETFPANIIAKGPPVGWGETGTAAYRIDVTSVISGNGVYSININGFSNPGWEIDGVTLFIIYISGPSSHFEGNLILVDGIISDSVADASVTLQGFNVKCSNVASAFSLYGDIQANYNTNINVENFNGTIDTFSNNFWNFNRVPTTLTVGQTSTVFQSYTNNGSRGSDGYSWAMAGIYWQDNCGSCNPEITFASSNPHCGDSSGYAEAIDSGGSPPFTYKWMPAGGTNAQATGLSAGNYTVTVEDAICNTTTATVTLANTKAAVTAIVIQNVSCFGESNGTANARVISGKSPYTYSWKPGGYTDSTATGLNAGTYTVTITDATGCIASATAIITQPTQINSSLTNSTNIFCYGDSTGSATIKVTGGTPIYTYKWEPGGNTNATATGLSAGTYTVLVTDSYGCISTVTVTLTQSPSISPVVSVLSNIVCSGGANGSATASETGGTSPFSYLWSPSLITNAKATGLSAGKYTVTITDARGCSEAATVSISQPDSITVHFTATFGCHNAIGSATANVAGGTPAYTYLWSSGATASSITGISAGTYYLNVTDANGCNYIDSVSLTQPAPLTATMVVTSQVSCNGGSNASATVTVGNGTPPYTYSWMPSGGTGAKGTGLSAGNYTVDVTDASGCTVTASVSITQPLPVTASLGVQNNVSCNGKSNGSDMVTAGGGTPGYTYSWMPAGGASSTASGLSAGEYTITVTDANGCTVTASNTISQPLPLNDTLFITGAACDSVDGSATASPSGGTPGYTFSWSPGGQTSNTITGLSIGKYIVTITDSHGCSLKDTASDKVAAPQLSISNHILCFGDTTTAIARMTRGVPPYSFKWSNNATTSAITGITVGTYSVSVTDSTNCTVTASITITQPMKLSVSAKINDISCYGLSNGKVTINAGGGTPAYSYFWSPGGGNNSSESGLTVGNFTVIVVDSNGCRDTINFSISQPMALTVNITNTVEVQCNGKSNGGATVTVSGGTMPYSYLWSPSGGNNAASSILSAGMYTVNVTDAEGCIGSASVTITQPPALKDSIVIALANCGLPDGELTAVPGGGTGPYTFYWSDGATTASITGLGPGTYSITLSDSYGCEVTNTAVIKYAFDSIIVVSRITCNGESNGSLNVKVYGGTSPYSYLWSPTNQTSATATGLSAGNYSIAVTDVHNCTTTASITITQPFPLTATMGTLVDESCYDSTNGNVTVVAAGGNAPYTYLWMPAGGTNAIASRLSAGIYSVTVTDANGCTTTASVTITQPSELTATFGTPTNVTCFGGNNGSVTCVVAGGTPAYTYSWMPSGETNAKATGLSAGTYTISINDAKGCSTTASVTLTQPLSIDITINSLVNVGCNGGATGSISITASRGTSPYTYTWSPGGSTNNTISGLSSGTYTIAVADSKGCSIINTVTLTQPATFTCLIIPTGVSCSGESNGSATTITSGGSSPYNYLWSPGNNSNSSVTGLSSGNYKVTVTDAHSCTTSASVFITAPKKISIDSIINVSASCGRSNGDATALVSGGTPFYQYHWSYKGQSNAMATGLSEGTYTISVTDANGCTASSSVTIFNNTSSILVTSTYVTCFGGSDGSANALINGGPPPYTYLWSNNKTTSSITSLTAGGYSLIVTDTNGCTATSTVNIGQPAILSATVLITTNVSCYGGSNGGATSSVSGGTSPYKYLWSPGGQSMNAVNGLIAGTDTLKVTDANGCTATAALIVTQPPPLTATMGIPTDISCNGGSNGSNTVSAGGGTPAYTYSWSPAGGSHALATGLSAGNYIITVKDANGCSTTVGTAITQPAALAANATIVQNVECFGRSDGSATANPTGGKSPYTYSWNTHPAQTTAKAIGLSAGNYTLTVMDSNGCSASNLINIAQPKVITASISINSNVVCHGDSTGSATVSASGGTPGYGYQWIGGSTSSTYSGLYAGTYTVIVIDTNRCIATAAVTITEPNMITAIMGNPANIACYGESTGAVSVIASNGTKPFTYLWSPDGGTQASANNLTAGEYTVTVTDNCNQSVSASVNIAQPDRIMATLSTPVNVSCFGGSTGSAMVTAANGITPYTYLWSPQGGTQAVAGNLTAGNYTVTVKDNCNESVILPVTISQPAILSTIVTITANIGCNGENNGAVTAVVSGGISPYNYLWSPGGQSSDAITGLIAGNYTIKITDANGCPSSASVGITQPMILAATIGIPTNVSCYGGSNGSNIVIASGGTPVFTYSWSPSGGTYALASGLTAGNYIITVTDAHGCSATVSSIITQPAAALAVSTSVNANVLCYSRSDGSALAITKGGTTPYTYAWTTNPSQTNAQATGLPASSYTVSLSDSHGCAASASVNITQPAALTISLSVISNVTCNGYSTGSATASASGGNSPYTFSWNTFPVQTNADAVGLLAGNYIVTVTDNCGQTLSASVSITQPNRIIAALGAPANLICYGGSIGSDSANASDGTPPYTYSWSNGNTQALAGNLTAGNYTVTVMDNCNENATASVTITQPNMITASMSNPVNIPCFGENTGSANVNAANGTVPYSYSWSDGSTQATTSNLTAGNYTVTVTDNCNESVTATVNISQPFLLTATATVTSEDSCYGESIGAVTTAMNGGTRPYYYSWSNGKTTASVTSLTAGGYILTVVDANGCTTTVSVNITQPSIFSVTAVVTSNDSCNGENKGIAISSVSGGTSPYGYQWSNGITTNTISSLTAGGYSLTVTDNSGCTTTVSVNISQPAALTVTIAISENAICNGGSNGIASSIVSGGTGPYLYSWSNGKTTSIVFSLTAGGYSVTLTDKHGCTTSASLTISEPDLISILVMVDSNATCYGESNGSATATATGGVAPYSYLWSNGSKNAHATGLSEGNYTVRVTDKCDQTAIGKVIIAQPAPPSASIDINAEVECYGWSNGSATVKIRSGSAPYTYRWSGGNGSENTASGLSIGSYTVTVTDACNRSVTASVNITQPVPIVTGITPRQAICPGIGVTLVASGGTTYIWNTGETGSAITVRPFTNTVYSVAIFIGACPAADSTEIDLYSALTATACCDTSLNYGQQVQLFATSPRAGNTYYWSPPVGLSCLNCQDPTVTPPPGTTIYTVSVTSDSNCVVNEYVTIKAGCGDVYLPNAFSPGESVNNILYVRCACCVTYESDFIIFDRWGNKVFETFDLSNGWDGKHNGQPMNSATFAYYLKATYSDGTSVEKKGNITLVR